LANEKTRRNIGRTSPPIREEAPVTRLTRSLLLTLAAVGAWCGASHAEEPAARGIVDGAALFRPEIVARADALIRRLHDKNGFDLRIETLSLPENERVRLQKNLLRNPASEHFARLGKERAEKANVNGASVLICTDPWYVQVTVFPDSARALFSRGPAAQLRRELNQLRGAPQPAESRDLPQAAMGFGWRARPASGADATLLAALEEVRGVVQRRFGDPNALPLQALGVVLAAGVGCWFLLALLSRRMAKRSPDAGILSPLQPDRRPALMAAQFGSPSAQWIYDRLFYGLPTKTADTTVAALLGESAQPELHHEQRGEISLHDELRQGDMTLEKKND
jgi:hypothetical protein